jgi:hypothetical protein
MLGHGQIERGTDGQTDGRIIVSSTWGIFTSWERLKRSGGCGGFSTRAARLQALWTSRSWRKVCIHFPTYPYGIVLIKERGKIIFTERDLRLPPQCKSGLCSSGMLCSVDWRTALLLKMWPTGCPETSVTNYQSMLRNIPEERRGYLYLTGQTKPMCPSKLCFSITRSIKKLL